MPDPLGNANRLAMVQALRAKVAPHVAPFQQATADVLGQEPQLDAAKRAKVMQAVAPFQQSVQDVLGQ